MLMSCHINVPEETLDLFIKQMLVEVKQNMVMERDMDVLFLFLSVADFDARSFCTQSSAPFLIKFFQTPFTTPKTTV